MYMDFDNDHRICSIPGELKFSRCNSSLVRELSIDELEHVNGGLPRYVSAAAGILIGVGEAGHVAGAVRAGLFGARIGGLAGPIGLAAGVVAGVGVYYVARNYL